MDGRTLQLIQMRERIYKTSTDGIWVLPYATVAVGEDSLIPFLLPKWPSSLKYSHSWTDWDNGKRISPMDRSLYVDYVSYKCFENRWRKTEENPKYMLSNNSHFSHHHPPSTHIFLFHQIENLREKKFATTSFRLPIHPRTDEKWSHPGSLSPDIIGVTGIACMDSKKAPEKHGDVRFAEFLANKICINFLCPK